MSICITETALAERGDSKGFQLQQTPIFNSKSGHKRCLKRRNTPNYRLIRVYSKSIKQYWKERNRRKQVLKLTHEGYTLQQIAKQLDVSYRTVRRDAVKLRPYIRGQFNKHMTQLRQEYQEKLEREVESLPYKDMATRFMAITNLLYKTRKLSEKEQYERHNNIIIINMDDLTDGLPSIIAGKNHAPFHTPYNINFVARKEGQLHILGGIKIG